jgi:hypothetical protein
MPVKPNPPPLTCIFKMIMHPYGIGPTKPIIRVPARSAMDTPANLMPHTYQAIVKSSPLLHSIATIQCQCGQLVHASDGLQTCNMPLYHTLPTFISCFIPQLFLFPPTDLFPFHVFVGDEGITLLEGGTCGRVVEPVWLCLALFISFSLVLCSILILLHCCCLLCA